MTNEVAVHEARHVLVGLKNGRKLLQVWSDEGKVVWNSSRSTGSPAAARGPGGDAVALSCRGHSPGAHLAASHTHALEFAFSPGLQFHVISAKECIL
jgi:hypothetical protein